MTYSSASLSNKKSNSEKGQISKLCHLWRFIRPYKLLLTGAFLALLFTSSAVLALGAALRYLVDSGIAAGNVELLDTYYFRLLVVVAVLAIATFARYFFISWVGERVVEDIRNAVFHKMIYMHVGYFETTRAGELLSRITTDTTLIQNVVGSSASIFLRNMLLFLGGTVMLVITSAQLTEYVLLMLPVVIAPIIIIGKRVRMLSRTSQNRVADISALAEESLSSVRTIQSMTLEEGALSKFKHTTHRARTTATHRIIMRSILTAIVISLVFGAVVSMLWIGGRDVINGNMSAGDLSAFIFYAVIVAASLGAISEVIGELQRAAGAAERLIELLQEETDVISPTSPALLPAQINGDIQMHNISFSYPSRPDTPSLESFNLHIEPTQTIAIVGPSGAGKSTIIQLLLRFYDPQAGRICIDGVNIKELSLHDLRQQIGLVPQETTIFSANAWDNIRCGNLQASEHDILEAAEHANALEFLEKLPNKLDTFLGEKGVRLSGGQRQRIAIARAIIRNPKILLLDEATSALDSENERLIQGALDHLIEQRTTIIIAHRLSTIQKANRIIVLSNGTIEATGTHDTLIKTSPTYKRLAELQFNNEYTVIRKSGGY